jgi:hypothetical protein
MAVVPRRCLWKRVRGARAVAELRRDDDRGGRHADPGTDGRLLRPGHRERGGLLYADRSSLSTPCGSRTSQRASKSTLTRRSRWMTSSRREGAAGEVHAVRGRGCPSRHKAAAAQAWPRCAIAMGATRRESTRARAASESSTAATRAWKLHKKECEPYQSAQV